MSIFHLYFNLGVNHIIDTKGYDHILFIIALCSVYQLKEWRKILILLTAFTAGHTTTLILATKNIVSIPAAYVEFLIPLTIFITALFNVINRKQLVTKILHTLKYFAALFFGLIHGLGFSNYLRGLLGSESNILKPLFSFNLGIEAGQIIIASFIILLGWLVISLLRAPRRDWILLLSGAAIGISLVLMIERFPWS